VFNMIKYIKKLLRKASKRFMWNCRTMIDVLKDDRSQDALNLSTSISELMKTTGTAMSMSRMLDTDGVRKILSRIESQLNSIHDGDYSELRLHNKDFDRCFGVMFSSGRRFIAIMNKYSDVSSNSDYSITLHDSMPWSVNAHVIRYTDDFESLSKKISELFTKLKRYTKESLVELKRNHPTLLKLLENIIKLSAGFDYVTASVRLYARDYTPGKLEQLVNSVEGTYDYLNNTESSSPVILRIKQILWFAGPLIKMFIKLYAASVIHPGRHGIKKNKENSSENRLTRDSIIRYNDGIIANKIKLLKAKAQDALNKFQKLTGKQKAISILKKLIALCAAALAVKSAYDLYKFWPDIKFLIGVFTREVDSMRQIDQHNRRMETDPEYRRQQEEILERARRVMQENARRSMANNFDPNANEVDRRMREEQERRMRERGLDPQRVFTNNNPTIQQRNQQAQQAQRTAQQVQQAANAANQVSAVANDLLQEIRAGRETMPPRQPTVNTQTVHVSYPTVSQRIVGSNPSQAERIRGQAAAKNSSRLNNMIESWKKANGLIKQGPRAGYKLNERKNNLNTHSTQASGAFAELLAEEGYRQSSGKYNFGLHKKYNAGAIDRINHLRKKHDSLVIDSPEWWTKLNTRLPLTNKGKRLAIIIGASGLGATAFALFNRELQKRTLTPADVESLLKQMSSDAQGAVHGWR
jgi:hypothetical protein